MVRTVLFLNPADSFIPPLEQRVFAGNSFSLGPVDQRSFNRLLNVFVGDVVIKVVQLQWIRTHVVEFRLLIILAIQREFPITGYVGNFGNDPFIFVSGTSIPSLQEYG